MWDIKTGTETLSANQVSDHEITTVCTDHPLQRKLYVGNSGGQLAVVNMSTGRQMSVRDVHAGALTAVMHCEHSRHIITCGADRSIVVFKEKEAQMEQLRILTDASDKPIVAGGYHSQLSVIATVSGEEIKLWGFQDLMLGGKLDVCMMSEQNTFIITTIQTLCSSLGSVCKKYHIVI